MGWKERPPDSAINELDDDQLIDMIRQNPDLFRVIYERYFQRVYRYCLKRTGDVQIAEDLSSEIFVKILSNLDAYKKGGHFAAWLFRISHHIVIDHYRQHKTVIALENIQLKGDSQMSNTIANQLFIKEMLSELTEEERELITLRLDAELSAPEIAELTGKTANAVRVQIYRILKRLRDRYENMRGESS